MGSWKRVVIVGILAVAFFCAAPVLGWAADETKPLKIEGYGEMTMPGNWKAVDIGEVLTRLDKFMPKPKKAPPAEGEAAAVGTVPAPYDFEKNKQMILDGLKQTNIKIYQVAVNDKDAYYIAWMLFYKDTLPLAPDEKSYFSASSSSKERKEFVNQLQDVQSRAIEQVSKVNQFQKDIAIEFLPAKKVEQISVKGAPGYGGEARIAMNVVGLVAPAYVKAYVFNSSGQKAYALLLTNDSERKFWEKTFRSMISSLR